MSREPPPGRWPGTGEPFIALATVHCVLSDIAATEALHASHQLLDEQLDEHHAGAWRQRCIAGSSLVLINCVWPEYAELQDCM